MAARIAQIHVEYHDGGPDEDDWAVIEEGVAYPFMTKHEAEMALEGDPLGLGRTMAERFLSYSTATWTENTVEV